MKIVKWLIWLGFAALLAVSVPKVAWVFRSYEQGTAYLHLAGVTIDALWIVPLFVAICIDALTLALTYAVSIDKARASQFSMWAFVALLCGLSYYCNLLYNDVPLRTNPFIEAITPFILAGVPLFALCYTLILSRIGNQGETLAEKAARLEQERDARNRIAAARSGRLTARITAAITSAGQIKEHAGKTFAHATETLGETQADNSPISAPGETITARQNEAPGAIANASQNEQGAHEDTNERHTDKITGLIDEDATVNPELNGGINGGLIDEDASENSPSPSATSQKSVSIKDAARLLGVSESRIRALRNNGTLRTAPRNNKLILKTSIDAYQNTRTETGKHEAIAPGMTPLKIVIGEQETGEQNTPVQLGMIEKRMYAILAEKPDELQALLQLASELDDLAAFTSELQGRYSQYAEYITPERVSNMLAYARQNAPALAELSA